MCSGIALYCSGNDFSCMKELKEQAAELMRPPAPKQGKESSLNIYRFYGND